MEKAVFLRKILLINLQMLLFNYFFWNKIIKKGGISFNNTGESK